MGVDEIVRVSWLQLERKETLMEAAELASDWGMPENLVEDVRTGLRLTDLEMLQAMQRPLQGARARPAFYIGEGGLLGAFSWVSEAPIVL